MKTHYFCMVANANNHKEQERPRGTQNAKEEEVPCACSAARWWCLTALRSFLCCARHAPEQQPSQGAREERSGKQIRDSLETHVEATRQAASGEQATQKRANARDCSNEDARDFERQTIRIANPHDASLRAARSWRCRCRE